MKLPLIAQLVAHQKRATSQLLSVAFFAIVFFNPAFAADPSAPGTLRHEVYSSTAAELFWERSSDDGAVVSYEVTQNGAVVANEDALSYFTDNLAAGVEYQFAVTAIDNDGNRSNSSVVNFVGGDRSAASGTVPAAPANLQSAVYSRTAAEIFWDRPAELTNNYEVFRDGVSLLVTDAISYYDDSLQEAQTYTFDVVTIAADGSRSDPASTTLTTRGAGTSTPAFGAPSGLIAKVYSRSAAELFWDRPEDSGFNYEIVRNGTTVGNTDGISFFDDTLSAGQSYTFEVVAINSVGERSAPAIVLLNTPDGSGTPVEPVDSEIFEPADLFTRDGYGTVNVVRMDVRTVTTPGVCTIDDQSGCTLDDVKADIDGSDDFKVEIAVHFKSDDFPDDGSVSNAELRQRGGFSRLAPQKSFRIKLDSKEVLWRTERRIQLNKNPYDTSRIRNKLAFDLMSEIPNLPSLRTQFVNLWIDDGNGPEDYGLFTHAEYVGKEYLINRERNEDDNLYKAEKFLFAPQDLEHMGLDEDGAPLDEDDFESRIEIKRGDDHRKIVEMIKALNDGTQSFESVMQRYFDEENVLTWVAVNFLIHQVDAVTHNFYLYNPVGSDKFYFLPWDYDGAFGVEQEPANSLERSELFRRLYYGYSKGRASNFLGQYYKRPGIHQRVLEKAEELRNSALMDSNIAERASRYSNVISSIASQLPDIQYNASYNVNDTNQFAGYVADSHNALRNYYIPLPPKLRTPIINTDSVTFRWRPAHDMAGNTLSYDLEISTAPGFEPENRLLLATGLTEADLGGYDVGFSQLSSGNLYARLIARSAMDPDRAWQIASNRPEIGGEMRVGVIEFTVP